MRSSGTILIVSVGLGKGGMLLNMANNVTTCGTTSLIHLFIGTNTRIHYIVATGTQRFVAPLALRALSHGTICASIFHSRNSVAARRVSLTR